MDNDQQPPNPSESLKSIIEALKDHKAPNASRFNKIKNTDNIQRLLIEKKITDQSEFVNLNKNDLVQYGVVADLEEAISVLHFIELKHKPLQLQQSSKMKQMNQYTLKNISNVILDEKTSECTFTLNDFEIVSTNPLQIKTKSTNIEANDNNTIENPLIVLLGISEFDELTCPRLNGVKYDMIALRRLFETVYNFTVIHENWRMYWSDNIIKKFWQQVLDELINPQTKELWNVYDGLIVIMSSHGDDNVIFDSQEKAHHLYGIYSTFGIQNPKLLQIPRIFMVDACRGQDKYGSVRIGKATTDDEKIDKAEQAPTSIHKGSNRVTIFGQSPGIQSFLDDTIGEELENIGSSFFIRSIIEIFTAYANDKKYINDTYTPSLSRILQNIKDNLFKISGNKQIPYKNGDVELDSIKIFKKRNEKELNKNIIYELNDYPEYLMNLPNCKYLAVRLYRDIRDEDEKKDNLFDYILDDVKDEDEPLIDSSSLSTVDMDKYLQTDKIEELIPVAALLKNVTISEKGEVIYHSETKADKLSIKVKLRSIAGMQYRIFLSKMYGINEQIMNHRYVTITIRNFSQNYSFRLLSKATKVYLPDCNFFLAPTQPTVPYGGGEQTFSVVGHRYGKNDPMYDSLGETGVVGALQYSIRDVKSDRKTRKTLVIAFRGSDPNNGYKDLDKVWMECWIVDSKECNKTDKLKLFTDAKKLKHSKVEDIFANEMKLKIDKQLWEKKHTFFEISDHSGWGW